MSKTVPLLFGLLLGMIAGGEVYKHIDRSYKLQGDTDAERARNLIIAPDGPHTTTVYPSNVVFDLPACQIFIDLRMDGGEGILSAIPEEICAKIWKLSGETRPKSSFAPESSGMSGLTLAPLITDETGTGESCIGTWSADHTFLECKKNE